MQYCAQWLNYIVYPPLKLLRAILRAMLHRVSGPLIKIATLSRCQWYVTWLWLKPQTTDYNACLNRKTKISAGERTYSRNHLCLLMPVIHLDEHVRILNELLAHHALPDWLADRLIDWLVTEADSTKWISLLTLLCSPFLSLFRPKYLVRRAH